MVKLRGSTWHNTERIQVKCFNCGTVLKMNIDKEDRQYVQDIVEEAEWMKTFQGWLCPDCIEEN